MIRKKVLVVDDSAFMRKLITDFLSSSTRLEVIGTARNGKDALEKIERLNPDVITMDVEMPEMNGIQALKSIMENRPLPVVMLSSTTREGAENTITAMNNGAIDFVAKPSGAISLDLHKVKEDLISKVLNASEVPIHRLGTVKENTKLLPRRSSAEPERNRKELWNRLSRKIICIGTSTGGPRALQQVVTSLPSSIPAPVLIVQHMPAGFTKSLAYRLNTLSDMTVKEAEDGELLKNGTAYIAPGGYHLKVTHDRFGVKAVLDELQPPRNSHRPAVDVMFESVSELPGYDKIAVIMTGMGADGSKGLVKLKGEGRVKAIAESEDTCIVYGMPKAAISTNLVDDIEALENIAGCIMKYMP
ncbi:chemotaxis response regulator protein-glutamate methylesterase [Rossellomorea vietnamensis]|uniref:Protein-glutamate methylesterase/protein-glutamine glutaminase n=1 Tax=Rossellomorea vietnamensis TaxID=218284 RepID=A0A5D4MER7_9BACI|nr:chemotaxis response regulator protein-glutamate methylesterase [Rossellomorea vietnamensis]TYS00152.1 chemotaxis response regulator protein-glutamate methylesterase [Rossellomorea vietnamensis]